MPAGVACRRSQQGRADRHLVHEAVMLAVDGAFGHDLRMHRHAGEELLFVGAHWPEPVAADAIAQSAPPIWCRPDRRVMPKVVPDVNALVQFGSGQLRTRAASTACGSYGIRTLWPSSPL